MGDFPVGMPTAPCSFCGGSGTMREEKRYQSRMVDEDEFTDHKSVSVARCAWDAARPWWQVVALGH